MPKDGACLEDLVRALLGEEKCSNCMHYNPAYVHHLRVVSDESNHDLLGHHISESENCYKHSLHGYDQEKKQIDFSNGSRKYDCALY